MSSAPPTADFSVCDVIHHQRPTVFDRNHALSRLGGLEDVLIDVMGLMITESTKVHAEIGAAHRRRDSVALKRSAHTLKGSVSVVGAADLVHRLKRVEDFAAVSDFDRAESELWAIDQQFAELQNVLAKELTSCV